jgi:endonuclease/exonuclease/phosphatase family metal-dependent hydrolase
MDDAPLACVSWNVHRARGSDGRVDPARVVDALATEIWPQARADILALQEADAEARPHPGLLDLDRIERETGLTCAQRDPELRWGAASHGFHGVVVFLAPGIAVDRAELLDLPGHCHRGAVAIEARAGGRPFRLVATHLSLGQPLRMAQLRVVGQYLDRRPERPTLLVGDLNEWRPWGGAALAPRLLGRRFSGPAPATFPVGRPLLPLDRILATPPARVRTVRALDGPRLRTASDHRPLAAEVILPAAAGAARPGPAR